MRTLRNEKVKKTVLIAIFTLFAAALSYIEVLIPPIIPLPGVKLGLANVAVIFVLYRFSVRDALTMSFARVFLTFLLFGSFVSFLYSLSGALASLLAMILLKKTDKFSVIGVSVFGSFMHIAAQVAVAFSVFSLPEIFAYLPFLAICSVVSGVIIGIVGGLLIKKVKI